METITCRNAYYVKLGRNGRWEESSLKKSIIRIGWSQQALPDINGGKWVKIPKRLGEMVVELGLLNWLLNKVR